MGLLHDEFERALRETFTVPSTKLELFRFIVEKHGCSLSDAQLKTLIQAIDDGADSVEIPDDGPARTISIGAQDLELAIKDLENKVETATERTITRVVEQIAPSVLKTLYDTLPTALREWHSLQRSFENRLRHRWKTGLDRLEMLITMAHESGETYAEDLCNEVADDNSAQEHALMQALTALQCRACRTAREIVCLLKAGYADGAHARWRSLHELAVTAFFLVEHQGETPQRYLDHAAVERWRAAKEYQQHCHVLGYDPFSSEELAELEKESDLAITKYGNPFKEDYGWAAQALGVPKPTFSKIEGDLKMSHWRPYFRLACKSVHAGSGSLFFSLGLPSNSQATLLAGASDAGLADPGHQMAISLTMVTVAFLTAAPNLDGLVSCHCMLKVCDDIGEELMRVHSFSDSEPS